MPRTRYILSLAHERFAPEELLAQAVEAERAGFDGIACSDHFQPWWEDGEPAPAHSGHAWVWLGAAGQATEAVALGTAVTGVVHRYHPAVVAQAVATLERLCPGRAFLGVGSGEALNEVPCGMDWPEPAEQLARLEEALEIIVPLLECRRVDYDGAYFRTRNAYLYTRGERRPPVYASAFEEGAAQAAGRLADGLWTLADPEQVPGLVDAYREGADEAGSERGEIILQATFSWAESDERAAAAAREWKATLVDEYYVEDWHDPGGMQAHAQATVTDEELESSLILAADPEVHVERIREVERLGATTVVLMNVSGADPLGAVRTYGEHVLPRLRGR
jgi:coenzyme F420-dependent glucose-6-phosphate dehydrogenase